MPVTLRISGPGFRLAGSFTIYVQARRPDVTYKGANRARVKDAVHRKVSVSREYGMSSNMRCRILRGPVIFVYLCLSSGLLPSFTYSWPELLPS